MMWKTTTLDLVLFYGLCVVVILTTRGMAASADGFFTQSGSDPDFEEVLKSGKLPRGRNSDNGFKGSKIDVNHELLKDMPSSNRRVIDEINIHTLGHSSIERTDFSKWSRWYQEDGNTQIFRLFKGEENLRNTRKFAARIEAFSHLNWKRGDDWQEWVGTYTIIKPHSCSIFQAKNSDNDWSVMINMTDNGDVRLNHRRGEDKVIARNMTGKPFLLRVRDNGHDYEVYFNGRKEGAGSYNRPTGKTNFRWGIYMGGKEVRHDAMILVTGAAVNPRDLGKYMIEPPEVAVDSPLVVDDVPAEAPRSLMIPLREWTNSDGRKLEAEARYQLGMDVIEFWLNSEWITYPISALSDADRRHLAEVVKAEGE